MIKTSMSVALLSSALIFSGSVFAETLEFSKAAVDNYKEGSASVKATMIMADGTKHQTPVQLQNNVIVKDLSAGNLIFVKKHSEVFEVTSANTSGDGVAMVEVKSTNLVIGPKKAKGKKKSR